MRKSLYMNNIRVIAFLMAIVLMSNALLPSVAIALTSGPASPEFSSFEPVGTTDMVNLFSGDFTYNLPVVQVPGPEGSGYSLSLSYHSGVNAEEEASWVGFGWTLNPGAINRTVKGFPDDHGQYNVDQYSIAPLNWTSSVRGSVGMEYLGFDDAARNGASGSQASNGGDTIRTQRFSVGLNGSSSIRFNSNNGFARFNGYGITGSGKIGGMNLNAGLSVNSGASGTTYQPNFSLSPLVTRNTSNKKSEEKAKLRLKPMIFRHGSHNYSSVFSNYVFSSLLSSATYSKQGQVPDMYCKGDFITGSGYDFSAAVGAKLAPVNISAQLGLTGSLHWSRDNFLTHFRGRGALYEKPEQSENILHDYYEEQDNPFSAKVLFTQVPFGNYDSYNVTNDLVAGTFKFYPHYDSEYYPNARVSGVHTKSLGVDLDIGEGVTIGVNLGGTFQRSVFYSEINPILSNAYQRLRTNQVLERFKFSGEKSEPIHRQASLLGSDINVDRLESSSKIYPVLARDTARLFYALKFGHLTSSVIIDSAIAAFDIKSTDGSTVKFGVPVLARKEANLSYTVRDRSVKGPIVKHRLPINQVSTGSLNVITGNIEDDETLQGQIKNDAYVSSYLISEIRKPNFIDINNNGIADSVDIGGYTKFHYEQKWGRSKSKWYRWRTPYSGLDFRRGQISSTKDNMGSFSSGEREVYYMKAIETPTHIAYFVTNKSKYETHFANIGGHEGAINTALLTGSQRTRLDAFGAPHVGSGQDSASTGNRRGVEDSEYLESIVLFSKSDFMQPIRVVRFDYDYSLVNGLPNSAGQGSSRGKLTLRKVWFESGGVFNTRTLPYKFDYTYKPHADFPDAIKSEYPELFRSGGYPDLPVAVQNPVYAPNLLDPWGYVMPFATERKKYEIDQRYQGPYSWQGSHDGWRGDVRHDSLSKHFDPASWQLKCIKLPSGGEILIQYEEKDYSYVQDKYPMAMASLVRSHETANSSTYWVEPLDLGYDPAKETRRSLQDKLERQCAIIADYFRTTKPYFKFLYQLDADHRFGPPNLDDCMSEYISGYANFESAEVDTITVPNRKLIKVKLAGGYGSNNSPRKACYDYYTSRKYGLWEGDDCNSGYSKRTSQWVEGIAKYNSPLVPMEWALAATQLVLAELYILLPQVNTYTIPNQSKVGAELNPALSFLKLPMALSKKGGGIRVKRLLTFDNGLSPDDASLYGHEFDYKTVRNVQGRKEIISSGVATNEPQSNLEESPYKAFLESAPKNLVDKLLSGDDAQQFEGPIGNTLIKDASVGHSRVVVQSINKTESGSGYSVKEFLTAMDYPMDMAYQVEEPLLFNPEKKVKRMVKGVSYTDISKPDPLTSISQNPPPVTIGFFSLSIRLQEVMQAYTFRLNSMHGQQKSTTDYEGTYISPSLAALADQDPIKLGRIVAGTSYEYFAPGEALPVVTPDMKIKMIDLGVEEEIAKTNYINHEITTNIGFEFDLAISSSLLIAPTFGISNFGIASQYLKSKSMSKVIRYPVTQKAVREFKNGVWIKQEFLAFDKMTGNPVFVAISDDADDGTNSSMDISMNIPAYWYYPEMASTENRFTDQMLKISAYGKPKDLLFGNNDSTWTWPDSVVAASLTLYKKNAYLFGGSSNDHEYYQSYMLDHGLSSWSEAQTKLNQRHLPFASYELSASNSTATFISGKSKRGLAAFTNNKTGNLATLINHILGSNNWIRDHQVEYFGPDGSPIQEITRKNIVSSAKFDRTNLVPTMILEGGGLSSGYFNDFEQISSGGMSKAHTGNHAMYANGQVDLGSIVKNDVHSQGLLIQFWSDFGDLNQFRVNGTTHAIEAKNLVEGWYRYETVVPVNSIVNGTVITVTLPSLRDRSCYIDDVKIIPYKSKAKLFVYDYKSYRLIAEFDEQHFATIYQFSADGKLVRKRKETYKGMKTIEEQHSNTIEGL